MKSYFVSYEYELYAFNINSVVKASKVFEFAETVPPKECYNQVLEDLNKAPQLFQRTSIIITSMNLV